MYGLVLEGGGARGAYQIGAVKALQELGIEIKGIAGTSIGAINGAMIAQGDLERAYEIWANISLSKVFDVNEEYIEELKNLELNQDNLQYIFKKALDILNNRGLDTSLMREILKENIDEGKLRNSKMDFGLVTVSMSDMKPLQIFIEDIPAGKVVDYLMASAGIPIFKLNKLEDKYYIDGGFYDNLPINLLLTKGYKDIIAVRTHGMGIIRRIKQKGVNIIYIDPVDDLGNILDFSREGTGKSLSLGYYDTIKVFKKLKGRQYYLTAKNDESFFVKHLLGLGEANIQKAAKILGLQGAPVQRLLFELIIPRLTELLNMKVGSTYEEIIIGLYEAAAHQQGLERFKIYSFEEFIEGIRDNYDPKRTKSKKRTPRFIRHSDVLSKTVRDEIINELIAALFEEANNVKNR